MRPGVGDVRAAAEVDEFALAVEADGGMLGQSRVDVLDFEFLVQTFAELARLAAVEDEPLERLGVFDDLFHLVFDLGEVLFAQLVRAVEVVVVAVGERRAEGEIHVGKEPHDRAGHDVCRTSAAGRPTPRDRDR